MNNREDLMSEEDRLARVENTIEQTKRSMELYMKSKKDVIKLKDIPCIKDQAYFIMVGLEGSWLYNACYPSVEDEAWCKNFVNCFADDYGLDEVYTDKFGEEHRVRSISTIQQHINESYEDIMEYRLKSTLEKVTS